MVVGECGGIDSCTCGAASTQCRARNRSGCAGLCRACKLKTDAAGDIFAPMNVMCRHCGVCGAVRHCLLREEDERACAPSGATAKLLELHHRAHLHARRLTSRSTSLRLELLLLFDCRCAAILIPAQICRRHARNRHSSVRLTEQLSRHALLEHAGKHLQFSP